MKSSKIILALAVLVGFSSYGIANEPYTDCVESQEHIDFRNTKVQVGDVISFKTYNDDRKIFKPDEDGRFHIYTTTNHSLVPSATPPSSILSGVVPSGKVKGIENGSTFRVLNIMDPEGTHHGKWLKVVSQKNNNPETRVMEIRCYGVSHSPADCTYDHFLLGKGKDYTEVGLELLGKKFEGEVKKCTTYEVEPVNFEIDQRDRGEDRTFAI